MIVAIGYGFGDNHIDKILSQALSNDNARRLLVVSNCTNVDKQNEKVAEVKKRLGAKDNQVVAVQGTAKDFLEKPDLHKELLSQIPPPAGSPF